VYPNAAPQAADFNQSKELWLGLEDHVLQYAQAEGLRVSVFTAPVLADDDPPYRGILVPRRFWKVAAWSPAAGVLAAAGFVLDQAELIDTREGVVQVPPLGSFRTFQLPIADIVTITGVDLGPLAAADVLARATAAPRGPRELHHPGDIVLA
jgi:endonuclease G